MPDASHSTCRLTFLNAAATKDLSAEALRARIAAALRTMSGDGGSSTHPTRALIMTEPPSIDANEITDKGYINQRAVLENRAALVEKLHATPRPGDVVTSEG